jgi:imidazolonepropionase-like amidohydrolase
MVRTFVTGTFPSRASAGRFLHDAGMLRRLLTCLLFVAPGVCQDPIALVGATICPGDGGAPIQNGTVVVREGRIVAVGPRAEVAVPAGVKVVDVAGCYLTPGLVDTHVHYSQTGWADGRPDARDVRAEFPYPQAMADNQAHPERFHLAFLHSGVTAVFDVGGYPWTRGLAAACEHDLRAPHVAAAGALLATYDPKVVVLPDQSQFVFPKDGDEARAAVRSHRAFGSAAIKVWLIETPERSLASLVPIVMAAGDEARRVGLPLIVHSTTLATAKVAVAAGAQLLVHSVEDHEVDDEFVAAMVKQGTFYCPTLTVRDGYVQLYEAKISEEVRGQLEDVHPSVKERVLRTEDAAVRAKVNTLAIQGMQKRFAQQSETMARNLVRLHAAGVPVVLGTDAGNPLTLHGPSIFPELEAMQRAGLSAADVLKAATGDAARAMGRGADLGVIAVGRVADLLVLKDDPMQDVRAFRSLLRVCRGGQLYERAVLLPR